MRLTIVWCVRNRNKLISFFCCAYLEKLNTVHLRFSQIKTSVKLFCFYSYGEIDVIIVKFLGEIKLFFKRIKDCFWFNLRSKINRPVKDDQIMGNKWSLCLCLCLLCMHVIVVLAFFWVMKWRFEIQRFRWVISKYASNHLCNVTQIAHLCFFSNFELQVSSSEFEWIRVNSDDFGLVLKYFQPLTKLNRFTSFYNKQSLFFPWKSSYFHFLTH